MPPAAAVISPFRQKVHLPSFPRTDRVKNHPAAPSRPLRRGCQKRARRIPGEPTLTRWCKAARPRPKAAGVSSSALRRSEVRSADDPGTMPSPCQVNSNTGPFSYLKRGIFIASSHEHSNKMISSTVSEGRGWPKVSAMLGRIKSLWTAGGANVGLNALAGTNRLISMHPLHPFAKIRFDRWPAQRPLALFLVLSPQS